LIGGEIASSTHKQASDTGILGFCPRHWQSSKLSSCGTEWRQTWISISTHSLDTCN